VTETEVSANALRDQAGEAELELRSIAERLGLPVAIWRESTPVGEVDVEDESQADVQRNEPLRPLR